jgi:hypothetical protein
MQRIVICGSCLGIGIALDTADIVRDRDFAPIIHICWPALIRLPLVDAVRWSFGLLNNHAKDEGEIN